MPKHCKFFEEHSAKKCKFFEEYYKKTFCLISRRSRFSFYYQNSLTYLWLLPDAHIERITTPI